jgi:hypothetical protein
VRTPSTDTLPEIEEILLKGYRRMTGFLDSARHSRTWSITGSTGSVWVAQAAG